MVTGDPSPTNEDNEETMGRDLPRATPRTAWGRGALLVLVAAALLGACDAPSQEPASKDTPAREQAAANAAAANAEPAAAPPVLDDCPGHQDDSSCQHAAPAAAAEGHFGGKFSLADSQALKTAAADSGEARTVRVEGTVASVCKKAGCWMVLQDGDISARVFTKQDRFFLPIDIIGKKASVEGKLQAHTISEKFAKHLEEDRGGDPSTVKGPSKELVLYASAVELM